MMLESVAVIRGPFPLIFSRVQSHDLHGLLSVPISEDETMWIRAQTERGHKV